MKQTAVKLLVEAVLIVFSVLLAFWIDDYRHASEDATLKAELYNRIYQDIATDSLYFSHHLSERSKVRKSLSTLIEYVEAGKIREDSLATLLQRIEWFTRYQSNNSTYTSIINSGLLRLFERDEVFMNVSRYYNDNANMIAFTDAYMNGSNAHLSPYLNLHFDRRLFADTPPTRKPTVDLGRFTSKEFINILYSLEDVMLVEDFFKVHQQNQVIVLNDIRPAR